MALRIALKGSWPCSAVLAHQPPVLPRVLSSTLPRVLRMVTSASGLHPTRQVATSCAISETPKPSVEIDIDDLAEKARLRLTPEEAADFKESITKIVDWFGQLQNADVAGVEPAIHASVFAQSGVERLREDKPLMFEGREEMMESVPSLEGRFIRVPRILGADANE